MWCTVHRQLSLAATTPLLVEDVVVARHQEESPGMAVKKMLPLRFRPDEIFNFNGDRPMGRRCVAGDVSVPRRYAFRGTG